MFEKKDKLESLIGGSTSVEGEIKMSGTLRVDGKVSGNIQTDWLIVGEKASIKGDVAAGGIIVGGLVEGNLRAKELIEVKHKGRVLGDISTKRLAVAEGGSIEGMVSMREVSNVIGITDKIKNQGQI